MTGPAIYWTSVQLDFPTIHSMIPVAAVREGETMQKIVHCSVVAAITCFLSVAIVISATHFNDAQAQSSPKKSRAVCGNELKKQCSGVFVFGNNPLECLKRDQEKLSPKCAVVANNVVRSCDRDAAQLCSGLSLGQGRGLECLTLAKRSVSRRCNAALDAAFLR